MSAERYFLFSSLSYCRLLFFSSSLREIPPRSAFNFTLTFYVYLIYGSRLWQCAKKRHEVWYRKIASILPDTCFYSRYNAPICMQRRLFLSFSDSDKFIVTFILNPFDLPPPPLPPPSYFRLVLTEVFGPISQVIRSALYFSSLSSFDRNQAHRHPTRKGASTCNAEMGSEMGSHVRGIEERPAMSAGIIYTYSDAKEESLC